MKKPLLITGLLLLCTYAAHARRTPKAIRPMPNELGIALPNFVSLYEGNGPSAGMAYRRCIGRHGRLSADLGIYVGYFRDNYYKSDRYNTLDGSFFLCMPGVQYHPLGNRRRANYAVGLSVLAGNIYTHRYIDPASGPGYTLNGQTGIGGLAITNDIVLNNPRHPHALFGAHLAAGYNFAGSGTATFVQVGLKFGAKF